MKELLDMNRIPQHIAIIMDGNGRWAMERGKDRSFGHQAGVDAVRRITSECTRLGVKFLTLYTFSTENWNRPADEVAALMGLVLTSLEDEIFMKNNVRFRVVGDRSRIPDAVNKKLAETDPNFYEPSHFDFERFAITTGARKWWTDGFDPKWYLQPFPITEINKGYGLYQNAGW